MIDSTPPTAGELAIDNFWKHATMTDSCGSAELWEDGFTVAIADEDGASYYDYERGMEEWGEIEWHETHGKYMERV